ncbi:MAG: hypothetical protein IJM27_06020 [Eubacterium sp.]|jgi:hypothetical protein|nr:hypothetical protein [Eubacterium sp.]
MTEEEKIVEYAKRKQALHISLGYEDAESEWYLERLIEEQKKQMAFTKISIAVSLGLVEIVEKEKEHLENQSALNS